jgi:hypothetical protein
LILEGDANGIFRTGDASDLAQQIGNDGISRLLEIISISYNNLRGRNVITSKMSENEITEELYTEILVIWRQSSVPITLVPVRPKIDRTYAVERGEPAIDFCFRDRYTRESFFGFECKILDEGDNRLYREYIENGLGRYLQGKYSSGSSAGSLIGYIRSGDVTAIISEVGKRVELEDAIGKMSQAPPILGFQEHYVSTHTRQRGISPFSVHHLFFCFDVIN